MHTGSARSLKLLGLLLFAIALTGVLVLAEARSAHASPPPTMRLDPPTIKLDGGEAGFSVDVVIEGVAEPGLGGFEFELRYDDTRINATAIQVGPFPSSLGGSAVCFTTLIEGIATFACTGSGVPGPTGSGAVASIDFSVKPSPPGKTELFLQGCRAADPAGEEFEVNGCKDGSVTTNPTPSAPPVGGSAFDPDLGALPLEAGAIGDGAGVVVWVIVAIATGALGGGALGAGSYARRRRR